MTFPRSLGTVRCGRRRQYECREKANPDPESTIKDLAIELDNRPGALAEMGEALGNAGVSIEGGGHHTARVEWHRADAKFTDNRYSRAHEWSFDGGARVAASASPSVVPVGLCNPNAVDPEEAFVGLRETGPGRHARTRISGRAAISIVEDPAARAAAARPGNF